MIVALRPGPRLDSFARGRPQTRCGAAPAAGAGGGVFGDCSEDMQWQ